jgi:hypothetical protein
VLRPGGRRLPDSVRGTHAAALGRWSAAGLLLAGLLRESVVLCCASSCQSATGAPWQVIESTGYPEPTTALIMPGSRVRVPPFPVLQLKDLRLWRVRNPSIFPACWRRVGAASGIGSHAGVDHGRIPCSGPMARWVIGGPDFQRGCTDRPPAKPVARSFYLPRSATQVPSRLALGRNRSQWVN